MASGSSGFGLPFRRHVPFYVAALCAAAGFFAAWLTRRELAVPVSANAFFVVYLVLTGIGVPRMTPSYLKRHAAASDEPVWIIFLVTFAAIVVAVASLFLLINNKAEPGGVTLALTLAAVPLGWFTIHMMAATHYAHLYWQPSLNAAGVPDKPRKPRGGLAFPGTDEPCGTDFLYFAYVIGMTAQTSDTNVTSSAMRRVNLVHSIVSFFFNTVLVAAAVNVAVTLGS